MRTAYGVLPGDHPKRTDAQLDAAVAMLEQGNPSGCAENILKPMMEQNEQVCCRHASDRSQKMTLQAVEPVIASQAIRLCPVIRKARTIKPQCVADLPDAPMAQLLCDANAWAMQALLSSRLVEQSVARHAVPDPVSYPLQSGTCAHRRQV